MRKNSKRASASGLKTLSRFSLFGPPPLLEGEDPAAYDEIVARVSGAVGPTDFIEEIWARDLVDVAWGIFRLRRIEAAFLTEEISEVVNDKASELAEADPELMEGSEKEKESMQRLLDSDSELSWEERVAQNPRAIEKFQEFWESARSTLDMNEIQANVMINNLEKVERIERLIMIAEGRLDDIIREIDRHRIMQNRHKVVDVEQAEFTTAKPKSIVRRITKKVA